MDVPELCAQACLERHEQGREKVPDGRSRKEEIKEIGGHLLLVPLDLGNFLQLRPPDIFL